MRTIRVAILGHGRSGREIHARFFRQDNRYELVAVVDPIVRRRELAARDFGCETFDDHQPLLKRDDIDLIVDATPSHLHATNTLELLKAGFHVVCEKPIAAKTQDVDKLVEAAKCSGKVFTVFQQSRFAPYFKKIREVVASGLLGDIVQISMSFNSFNRRYDWQTLKAMMGGSLLNNGSHAIDQALVLFGDGDPSVSCIMRKAVSHGDAEDHILLTLTGPGRPIINIEISGCCVYRTWLYNIYGTCGGLKANATEVTWRYFNPKRAPRLRLTRTPISNPDGTPGWCSDSIEWHERAWSTPPDDPYVLDHMTKRYYELLYKTISKGTPFEITHDEVRRQVRVIEQARKQNPDFYPSEDTSTTSKRQKKPRNK